MMDTKRQGLVGCSMSIDVKEMMTRLRRLSLTFCVLVLLISVGTQFVIGREPRPHFRTVSGYILSQQNERLPGVTVIVSGSNWDAQTISDREGYFRVDVPVGAITIRFEGKNVQPFAKTVGRDEPSVNLEIKVNMERAWRSLALPRQ